MGLTVIVGGCGEPLPEAITTELQVSVYWTVAPGNERNERVAPRGKVWPWHTVAGGACVPLSEQSGWTTLGG